MCFPNLQPLLAPVVIIFHQECGCAYCARPPIFWLHVAAFAGAGHSANEKYYTAGGNVIPGIRINGMNVLAVKQGFAAVREHCSSGNGPMFVEFDTYRYHGHSMSDPGTTYRTREEVGGVRQARDPIEYVKKLLVEHEMCTTDEIKDMEKEIRSSVQESLKAAKAGSFPEANELYKDIYADAHMKHAPQKYIRTPDYHKSIRQ